MPLPKEKQEKKGLQERKFDELKEIVEMKKQKAVANELDDLIHDQEKKKKEREVKTKKFSHFIDIFVQNPEKLKDLSLEEIAKISMLSSSENAKEFGKWTSAMKTNEEKCRINYLEKRIETIEKNFESKIAFLEKLILEKL